MTQDGPFSATMKTTFSEFYFAPMSPKISFYRQRYFNSINIPGIKNHNLFPLEPTVWIDQLLVRSCSNTLYVSEKVRERLITFISFFDCHVTFIYVMIRVCCLSLDTSQYQDFIPIFCRKSICIKKLKWSVSKMLCILVKNSFVDLGETVHSPRWGQFFDFSIPSYGCFCKKKLAEASKSLPPHHYCLSASNSRSALSAQALRCTKRYCCCTAKARRTDQDYCGTEQYTVGPAEGKLGSLGRVHGIMVGAFGEGSDDLHALISHLAMSRVRYAGPQLGRSGQPRSEEAEIALATSFLQPPKGGTILFFYLREGGRNRDWGSLS